jgi:PqqD family protein of HPr-rel-A system
MHGNPLYPQLILPNTMNDEQASLLWGGLPGNALLWEEFGDEYLVYNCLSGETHFLNITAAEVLKLLQAEPNTLPGLVARICAAFGMEEEPALAQFVSGLIQEFDHAGLICSIPA